ncbi:MAG TPA: Scr1 family TA system antitoxin-like transcriptional regulator [Streptosporangiaceae bacterium]|nr:Scr1 family TA system antitoxin-like transcriptional regulator [Streptosporangiaceae bacterium]
MPDHGSQTIRRRRLAAELRWLRERAGLTGDEAAERLGWSGSKISRIETHRIGVKSADLKRLLDLYEVEVCRREELQALARESSRTGCLASLVAGLPTDHAEYLSAEDEARSIWNWDPQIVPVLLQTEAYARAVHRQCSGCPRQMRSAVYDSTRRASNYRPGTRRSTFRS